MCENQVKITETNFGAKKYFRYHVQEVCRNIGEEGRMLIVWVTILDLREKVFHHGLFLERSKGAWDRDKLNCT